MFDYITKERALDCVYEAATAAERKKDETADLLYRIRVKIANEPSTTLLLNQALRALIDADVLKEIIGECPENWTNSPEEIEAFNMWHRTMDDINSTPTVNDWISVKDRLPEKSGWYLVSLVNTCTGHRWEVPVPADYSHGEWDYAYVGGKDATWMLNNMVTHWMPRPKPPEKVNKDA